jgi:hypothetical protein
MRRIMTRCLAITATRNRNHPTLASLAALLACVCVGCSGGLNGSYAPVGQTFGGMLISDVTFNSAHKVEVTAMGMTHEGTYVLDGKRVKITVSGDTTIMTIDDQGCLYAGEVMVKFCKKRD